ncbi:MAG: hypothetical protein KDB07_12735, partial [Planctomycetes bacterium]|nr:hypothetical protein [Planctomycetota bacterium]
AFGHDAFQRALLPQLKATEARVRANAAKAMFTLGSPLALRILEAMGESRTIENRLSGVWALANLKKPETIQRAFDFAKYEKNNALQRRMLRFIDDAEDDIREAKFGSRPLRRVA